MSTAPSTDKKTISALSITADVQFTSGISAKSGNEYLVGAVLINSPISDTPIRLGFEYIDPNIRALLKMAFDKIADDAQAEFAAGVKN